MPLYMDKPESADCKSDEKSTYYRWPCCCITPTQEIYDLLKQSRKDAVREQEYWSALQKQYGRDDREFAKFCKEQSRYYLRLQRACTLMVPYFGEPDKNQEYTRSKYWPIDLVSELDEISYRIILI